MRCYELRRDALREGACANPDDISTVPLTPLFRIQSSFLLSGYSPPSLPDLSFFSFFLSSIHLYISLPFFHFPFNSVRNVEIRIVVTGHHR